MFILILLYFSFITCENEFIGINCKAKEIRYKIKNNWLNYNNSISCPIKSEGILKICNSVYNNPQYNSINYVKSKSMDISNIDLKIYQCIINDKQSEALSVPDSCSFNHTAKDVNICLTKEEWQAKAGNYCINYGNEINFELVNFNGIFQCKISDENPQITYKSIQYVCCPKLDAYDLYKMHLKDMNSTFKSEKQAFRLAKKTLRKKFKLRQKEIQDRFILEESSIDFSLKNPKLASALENQIQNKFSKKFMFETTKEVELMKELEIIHENRMQRMFEKNRKSAKSRLEYTLQETNPQANRIAEALKLELVSILSEAKDITEFYETLLKEGLADSERSKVLLRENFNSLIIRSWDEVIGSLNGVSDLKDKIMKQITDYEIKKQNLIKRFKSIDNDKVLRNSMKNQVKNHVKNMISLYGHGSADRKELHNDTNQNNFSIANRSIIILLFFLCIMIILSILILLYRFHGKINSYLSTTFKKIHPPTKNLIVHVDNYPFKNLYNYGNGIFQPIFKSEESIIGHPNSVYNQHFTSLFEASSEGMKNSHQETDFKESSININGLENPICRLLDEK